MASAAAKERKRDTAVSDAEILQKPPHSLVVGGVWGARLPDVKIVSLPFLGLRQGGGCGGAKEKKGSNFAV